MAWSEMHAEARATPRWEPAGPTPEPAARLVRPVQPFPDRYRVQAEGRASILTCTEAPTIRVHLERGLSITATEARSFPPGSIFLDGTAHGEPFLCPERAIYNLDHHEGCVRAFTLATCEQAMVLLRKRLDLRRREWTIYANDADLDALLAIWVLVNHLRLVHQNPELCARILPLLRLEGVIDALGRELQDLCALPQEQMAEARACMEKLLASERKLKGCGRWGQVDLGRYVAQQLRVIDRMVYPREVLSSRAAEIEELARAEIAPGSIAVVCRSDLGVYDVEEELRRLHGERLGLFALQKEAGTYTLRQIDPSLPTRLAEIYAQLNLLDPGSDGCASANRWGGSDEIGGSPRLAGTRMSPQQIVEACRRAHRLADWRSRVLRFGAAIAMAVGLVAVAISPERVPEPFEIAFDTLGISPLPPVVCSAAFLLVLGGGLLVALGRRTPGLYGHRSPTSYGCWRVLPLALAGAACGGLWIPMNPFATDPPLTASLALFMLVALSLAVELAFRGLIHGTLAKVFPIQCGGGPWRLSVPILASSVLYAACVASSCGTTWPPIASVAALAGTGAPLPLAGGFVFGVATGLARERSESVAASVLLHWLALGAWLGACALGR